MQKTKECEGGTCYQDAGRVVAFEDHDWEAVLVHGSVFSKHFGRRIDHAWVILPPNSRLGEKYGAIACIESILDLTLPEGLRVVPSCVYHGMADSREDRRYERAEVVRLIRFYEHWGPWHLGGKDGTGD